MKISKIIKAIPPSGIRKFFDLASHMEDIISLGVGEPDFPTPWHIREAGIYALENGNTTYTSNWGILELREAISEHLYKLYKILYDPEGEILITTGSSEALDLAIRAIIEPGDEVIIHQPSYVSYLPCVILAGGVPKILPTYPQEEFKINPQRLKEMITNRTKAIILNYPNNPTGAIMDRDTLLEIAEIVDKYDLIVISDEIYDRLVYDGKFTSFASLPNMKERTILINGFSKAYAMTGWRLGYAAGNREIVEAMMKIHQYTMLCAPTVAQFAALEALKLEEEVEKMRDSYNQRRRFFYHGLKEIGFDVVEPKGAFYIFPSVKKFGLSCEEFAERLLREKRVVVIPGSVFGECGEGFIRCTYASSLSDLKEALRRMGEFVSSLTPSPVLKEHGSNT
ncbi:aminotransferase class I/II-fold pyridoxal phosphate-dependent enzyme [bacterium]|nr:aminotransferase class I/II-fold pyridoxal phosphate-dependent enzyme [bacterium]